MKLTKEIARKLLTTVDAGLCAGLGEPMPGQMCFEAATCFAEGSPHGDRPTCVGNNVRDFGIALNDAPWSSDKARALGMRKLALAQLGSDTIDQFAFREMLAFKGITKIQPDYMRKHAEKFSDRLTPAQKEKIHSLASECEMAKGVATVKAIIQKNNGFGFGGGGGGGVGFGFGGGVGFGFGGGFGFGFGVGWKEFQEFFGDEFLNKVAGIGLECLIELKSPGCEFLSLCEL